MVNPTKPVPKEGVLVVGDRAMPNSLLVIIYEACKEDGLYCLAGLEPRTNEHAGYLHDLLASVSLQELRAHYLLGKAVANLGLNKQPAVGLITANLSFIEFR